MQCSPKKISIPSREKEMQSEEQLQVPMRKRVSKNDQKNWCEIHSSPNKKEQIMYFNLGFLNKKTSNKVERTFMCQKCYDNFKSRNPKPESLEAIKSKKQFYSQHIQYVLQIYANRIESNEREKDIAFLNLAKGLFVNEIDELNKSITQKLNNYKKIMQEIFTVLQQPIKPNQITQFQNGKFNEGMIEQLYKNSKKVKNFKVLLTKDGKEVVNNSINGLKVNFKEIGSDFVQKLYKSQKMVKLYFIEQSKIQKKNQSQQKTQLNPPKNLQKKPSLNQNKSNIVVVQKKIRSQEQRRIQFKQKQRQKHKKIKNEEKIRMKMKKLRHQSSSDSSIQFQQKQDKIRYMQNKKKQPESQQRQRKPLKYHPIRKVKHDKVARRSDIMMIGIVFLTQRKQSLAKYIVNRVNSDQSQSEQVFTLPELEFKRRYPLAYKEYFERERKGQN